MKKLLPLLLTTLLLFPYALTAQNHPWKGTLHKLATSTQKGDVNGDGSINITDVTMLVAHILGQQSNDFIAANADVTNDGNITITDVTEIVAIILNGSGSGDSPQAYLTCPDENHPHMIDLGLYSGTLWACCNVGANTPEGYGGYYAWGETYEKGLYYETNYSYYDIYDITGTQYDVAHVRWGGSWVMPSESAIRELLLSCSSEWTTQNGVDGRLFTGSNGGSIFLPAAGICWVDSLYSDGSYGYYWSSTRKDPLYNSAVAYDLWFNGVYAICYNDHAREYGHSVRPVVLQPIQYDDLAISINSLQLYVGESCTVEITLGSGSYTVESNDETIATATYQPFTITVTAIGAGATTITVTDTKTNQTANIDVTVLAVPSLCPDDNHPHMIDLGLPSGTKWACCNVNSDYPENQSPTNYGGYYAWGETETKNNYSWSTYSHCDGSKETCRFIGDICGTEYDVAHVKWGGNWHLPNLVQMRELVENCTYEWTTINNVSGGLYTSKTNDNSVFIPASGFRSGTSLSCRDEDGDYWIGTPLPDRNDMVRSYQFLSDFNFWNNFRERFKGFPVRPVASESIISSLYLSKSDIGLFVGSEESVEVTSGSCFYSVKSSNENIAIASVQDFSVHITAIGVGDATITVTDTRSGQTANIDVHVISTFSSCPDEHHPHMIDLGLPSGTKWACCNVGANYPEGSGGYYAWGETEEKDYYDWDTYLLCDGTPETCYEITEISGSEYDVAHVKWGDAWRMPTFDDAKELYTKCSKSDVTFYGTTLEKFTGPNGNSIIIPYTGIKDYDRLVFRSVYTRLWSSTRHISSNIEAYQATRLGSIIRYAGVNVRPVYDLSFSSHSPKTP